MHQRRGHSAPKSDVAVAVYSGHCWYCFFICLLISKSCCWPYQYKHKISILTIELLQHKFNKEANKGKGMVFDIVPLTGAQ